LVKFGTVTQARPLQRIDHENFEFLKIQNGGGRHLEITKIVISPQRFYQSLRNLVRWCTMGLLTAKNSRWLTAAIMKTVKSPYLPPFDRF